MDFERLFRDSGQKMSAETALNPVNKTRGRILKQRRQSFLAEWQQS